MDSRQIRDILRNDCGLEGKRPLLVGVSGGADSLCLLSLINSTGVPLVVAHFNHQLRPESALDERAVAQIAESMKCFYVSGAMDVHGLAEKEGLNLEAAAREARYTFLFSQARRLGAEAVAVGHTADDQVETILMHILRGSGLDGLKGMSYRSLPHSFSEETPLIRPLLGFWRKETEEYCASNGLKPLEDGTNQDRRFMRNRLRLELIPELESFNPQFKRRLWTLGQVAQSSLSGTAQAVDWMFQRCLIRESTGKYAALSTTELVELPDGWLVQVLRRAISRVRSGIADIDYRAMQRAVGLVRKAAQSGQVDLGEELTLAKAYDRIYVLDGDHPIPTDEWPQLKSGGFVGLDVPGELDLGLGWRISAEILAVDHARAAPGSAREAWLDKAAVTEQLSVRAWRSGDRFQPFGMSGSAKVSDFFINQKIPRPARRGWPLVLAGDEIVWIAGLRSCEKYRLTAHTREIIRLTLTRSEPPPRIMN